MNEYTIDGILKREFKGKENPEYWRITSEIWRHVCTHVKQELKFAADAAEKAGRVPKAGGVKLTEEERMEKLKEILDSHLVNGELPEQFKEFSSIFGFSVKSDPVTVDMVDFSTAYPDYAASLAISSRQQPSGIEA